MNKKIIVIAVILLVAAITGILFVQKSKPIANNPLFKPSINPNVKTETICTDNIDNEGDGMTDNEDGDCWIREGAVFIEDFEPVWTFNWLKNTSPKLKDIGIKTIETLPVWEPTSASNHFMRWGVKDYYKLNPKRGTEPELSTMISEAHSLGLKILPMIETGNTVAATSDCSDRMPADRPNYYDKDGIGGFYYQYQAAHPDKNIILKDTKGRFDCIAAGWGYALNMDSRDYIEMVKAFYQDQIIKRDFDGLRLDSSARLHCVENEKVYLGSKQITCPDPVERKHSPLVLFRALKTISPSSHVFFSEAQETEAAVTNYMNTPPYYSMNPDMDEVTEVSEGYEFTRLIADLVQGKKTSADLVDWINNQPVYYDRQRIRMFRNWNGIDMATSNFIAKDLRYYPAVTLAVTIPGVPAVSHSELFGNEDWESKLKINVTNTPESRMEHWKKTLNIRNYNNALKYGNIKNIWESGDRIYAYSRTYENETVIVAVNFQDKATTSVLNLPFKAGTILIDELSGETFIVTDPANFKFLIPAYGARILTNKK